MSWGMCCLHSHPCYNQQGQRIISLPSLQTWPHCSTENYNEKSTFNNDNDEQNNSCVSFQSNNNVNSQHNFNIWQLMITHCSFVAQRNNDLLYLFVHSLFKVLMKKKKTKTNKFLLPCRLCIFFHSAQ